MRVKNTQEQKQFHNVFFRCILFISQLCFWVVQAFGVFLGLRRKRVFEKNNSRRIIDFLVKSWPESFNASPSAYKVTRFFGDFIHHIFLKK